MSADARGITTFKALLSLIFGGKTQLATQLHVPYREAAEMFRTGRIPPCHWDSVIAAAQSKGVRGVTIALLQRLPSAKGATTTADLVALWPSQTAFAGDLDLPVTTVRSWAVRNSIPLQWWDQVIESAARHGISHLTVARLRQIAATRVSAQSGPPVVQDAHHCASASTQHASDEMVLPIS